MNRSKSNKFLCPVFLALAIFSSCNFWQTAQNDQNNSNSHSANELKSEIPFATKEPEIYECEFVITNYLNGEKQERIISVARNGRKFRYDFPTKISFLQLTENERFLIDNERNIYAKSRTNFDEKEKTEETLKDFLTTKWLNEKHDAKFEDLGTENGLAKYRVVLNGAESTKSETIIYFDEELKIPVKQEFSLIDGDEQKTKVYLMEIRDLKLETDEKRFELPKDFKQISVKEFQAGIWKRRSNSK